ncbi:MAG: FKBP-type peptidyl-prolyl cis-trans isomerase [Pseudomonadota bacterium]
MKTASFTTLVAALFSLSLSPALHAQGVPADTAASASNAVPAAAPLHIASLGKIDTQVGTGAEAVYGSQVEVHYTGWLYNPKAENLHGAKFDSSRDAGTPFAFQVGGRQVIKGWDLGVVGMKVGGKRTLMIPSYLGYSTKGSGSIPPNAHLVFDIELLSVK